MLFFLGGGHFFFPLSLHNLVSNFPYLFSVYFLIFALDKRYKPVNEVPQAVLESMKKEGPHSPGFSIKGEAREGRAAYLDFQATTPMDPRVVDAMVSKNG